MGKRRKWRAREKGGNGARYGEMARKLGIVTGNGRRSTPLTERKLEPKETVGGQPLPACDLCKPYIPSEGGQRRKRTRIPYEQESRKRSHVNVCCTKKEIVSFSFDLHFFFPFLCFSNCSAETVREIKLTPPTC